MYSKKNKLMRWVAIAGIIVFCGVAWSVSGEASKPASGRDLNGQRAMAQRLSERTRLHDEVLYFGDLFSEDLKRLNEKPAAEPVDTF